MITVLKGSPQYSIDSNGFMTIVTTWMLMPDDSTQGWDWFAFENDVIQFVGEVGDTYKQPKKSENSKEITEYTDSNLFVVSDVSYSCVSGRTHYEVTFTNVQNSTVMVMEGNVSAQINESNEKTKSITYRIDIPKNDGAVDPLAIDAHFIESGTTVTWASEDYLVSDSSYSAQSATRYTVSINAKDMSVMQIGNTEFSSDGFGQKTASATWRYSTKAYDEWEQPIEGDDASAYIGTSGYIISSIAASPVGSIGYNVKIDAVHVSKRHVTTSYREYSENNGRGSYTESTIQYQSDAESLGDFQEIVNESADDFGRSGETINEVTVSEASRNNYNVNITTTSRQRVSQYSSADDMSASMSSSEFTLDAKQCGWFTGLSGELYQINIPPTTRFTYTMSPTTILEQAADSGNIVPAITESSLLGAIKSAGSIGFDRIIGVQAETSSGELKWLTPTEISALTSLDSVQLLKLSGFVYAQPTMSVEGRSFRSLLFKPWVGRTDCPLYFGTWESVEGRNVALKREIVGYKFKVCEFSINVKYNGNLVSNIKNNFDSYYRKAISYIKSSAFTSYKGISVSMSDSTEDNKAVTTVTCTIQALLASNKYSPQWNKDYDGSYIE